jgi:hypothetical protein
MMVQRSQCQTIRHVAERGEMHILFSPSRKNKAVLEQGL